MTKKKTDISKKYTPRELAESFVFRTELTHKEKEESDNALRTLRKKAVTEMSEGQKLSMNLLGLKYEMEDYAKTQVHDLGKTFGMFIKKYAKIIQRKNYELADDLGIDETRFSQIVNSKIIPGEKIVYRLEYHSDNIIPGIVWLEILHKDIEHKAEQDIKTRTSEYKTVKKRMDISSHKIGFVANKTKDVQERVKELSSTLVSGNATTGYITKNAKPLVAKEQHKAYAIKKTVAKRKK